MPIILKPKSTTNSQLPTESVRQYKRRSLSTKLKQNSQPKFNQSNQPTPLPSISKMVVTDSIRNRQLSHDLKPKYEQNYVRKVREEKQEKNISVKQKVVLNPRERKVVFGQRKKVLTINQNPSKINNSKKNTDLKHETSILEIPISSTKKSLKTMKTITKLQSRAYIQKNQNQKIKSRFVDASIQTDNCQMSKQSYDEYIKFRITQRQKFEKLKSLFKFIQNFTAIESQNLEQNRDKFHQLLKLKDDTALYKNVNSFLLKLKQKYLNFDSLFKKVFSKEKQNIKEFHQNHTEFLSLNKKLLKDLEQKLNKLQNNNEKPITSLIQEALNQTLQKYQILSKENNRSFKEKSAIFSQNYNSLEQKYTEWQRICIEHSGLIKSCVMNVLKLPELSIGLYGTEIQKELSNDDTKKNTDEKVIPEIMDFLINRNHPVPNQINEFFLKCCEPKCMNCIFIRTKMRLIEQKNNELKPTVKLLMNLVSTSTSNFQFK